MELNYDWRGFQAVFHPYRRRDGREAPGSEGAREPGAELTPAPIFVVTEGEFVLAASIEDQDPTPWIGQTVGKLTTDLPGRELIVFGREDVDRWMNSALGLPHFFEQAESLRLQAEPKLLSVRTGGVLRPMRKGALDELTQQHFLLAAIPGWWRKVMPRAYGIYLRLEPSKNACPRNGEASEAKELFLLVRRGRIEVFHEPDLTGMGQALGGPGRRQRAPAAVVKYLSEKHLVRVQGLVVREDEWAEWSDPANRHKAWRKLTMAIRAKRARLVPFRWQVMGLLATRGFFKV